MSRLANKAIINRVYEAFNRRDINALDEFLASEFVDRTAGPEQSPGRLGMKEVWASTFAEHPDIRATVEDVLAVEDRVATRVTLEAASMRGGKGMMLEIVRISRGQIVELWNILKTT